jgi:hypothetical protein
VTPAVNEKTLARAGEPARAIVCADGVETPYLRAGRGDVVVLLMAEYDGPCALELIELLSAKLLVITPRVPALEVEGAFGSWLSNVLDGLGIAQVSVAAEASFIADVLQFVAAEEVRVQRFAFLTEKSEAVLQWRTC